ncbi:MAG: hypothetical protein U0892_07645 [Pirellulales bacterium]
MSTRSAIITNTDPISQRAGYQLFAFYNSDQDVNTTTPEFVIAD